MSWEAENDFVVYVAGICLEAQSWNFNYDFPYLISFVQIT